MAKNLLITVLAVVLAWLAWRLHEAGATGEGASESQSAAVDPDSGQLRSTAGRFAELEGLLEEMSASPVFAGAAIGFCLLDRSGAVVVEHNSTVAQIPASTFKTLTSATALEILGPEFRFETQVVASAEIENGVLDGDLVIVGSGDPMLDDTGLQSLVASLKSIGLERVTGRVIGDATCFPEETVGEYWNWGDVGNGYGSPFCGLNLRHNRFLARFQGGASIGDPAQWLGVEPEVPEVEWDVVATSAAPGSGDGIMIYGGPGATTLRIRGTVPAGELLEVEAVPNPPLFAAHRLSTLLGEAGIAVEQAAAVGEAPAGAHPVASHESVPLLEIVRSLHRVSDNHETECLFQLLASRAGRSGAEVIREHWRARGLDLDDCRIEDGSGLSRADTITPEDLARLQFLVRRGEQGEAFYSTLNSYHGGAVRWKGGAMSGVRSYCGFVTSASGEEFAFALMFNHYGDGRAVSEWRDRLVRSIISL